MGGGKLRALTEVDCKSSSYGVMMFTLTERHDIHLTLKSVQYQYLTYSNYCDMNYSNYCDNADVLRTTPPKHQSCQMKSKLSAEGQKSR